MGRKSRCLHGRDAVVMRFKYSDVVTFSRNMTSIICAVIVAVNCVSDLWARTAR